MSATISTRLHARWLPALLRGQPHEIIGDLDAPYLKRWHLIPPNRRLNVYLHRFCRSDEPGALHDHPWDFASLLITGRYLEVTDTAATVRSPGSLALRRAEHRHRIRLFTNGHGTPQRCWSLVITGPRRRQWRFWCPTGAGARRFVPWQIYGNPSPATPPTPKDRP